MQISIKLLISATLLIAASTSGYTAQAQEATGETTRRTFKFTTYTEETRAKDWAQQIVDFCQHVIINDTVKTRLYDTSFTLFRDYPAQATKNQERVEANIPKTYSALEALSEPERQIEHLNSLLTNHIQRFEAENKQTTTPDIQ